MRECLEKSFNFEKELQGQNIVFYLSWYTCNVSYTHVQPLGDTMFTIWKLKRNPKFRFKRLAIVWKLKAEVRW